ncbi:hypothetical protein [Bosea sp. BK604]|uniref:hypothetical protein n=1 Tax=Bosea sp. BK604 TaxID=2512180 RepID=UPI0010455B1E|nr:hypothetical protein [Bosea sp. BK604]
MSFDELPEKPRAVINAGRAISRSVDNALAKLEDTRDIASTMLSAIDDPKEELFNQLRGIRDDIRARLVNSMLAGAISRTFGGESADDPDIRRLSERAAEMLQTAPANVRDRIRSVREALTETVESKLKEVTSAIEEFK